MKQDEKDAWDRFGEIPIGYCPSEYISWPQFVKLMGVDEHGMVPQLYRINDYLTTKYGFLKPDFKSITEGNIKRDRVAPPPTNPIDQRATQPNRTEQNNKEAIDFLNENTCLDSLDIEELKMILEQ